MKKTFITIMIGTALFAASCGQKKQLKSGINPDYLDTSVLPSEDFYQYACGGWMKNNPLTGEYARFGAFDKLAEDNRKQVNDLISEIAEKTHKSGTPEQKIGDLYNLGMDSATIEKQGAEPIQKDLKKIAAMKNINDLTAYLAENALYGATPLFGLFAEANPDDSKQCIAWIWQTGLGIGDRDYYLEDTENTLKIRKAYLDYLSKLMQISGYKTEDSEIAAQQILAFETQLAKAFMNKETMRDPFATKNVKTIDELKTMLPVINFDQYFKTLGLKLDKINIGQVDYIKQLNEILTKADFNVIKDYLACQTISASAPYLSSDFVNANFDFYGRTLSGKEELRPRWKRVTSVVENYLGEQIGQIYVKKYFPKESKDRMLALVDNLKIALRERIEQNTWMADETKQKSYEKLDAFIVKIGYPDKWRDYSDLKIDNSESYYANVERASKFETAYQYAKIGKPVDPTEWLMTPQTVNAYYNPTTNEICFPAGILQPPFFNSEADDAVNYGAIGVVIGHEMSHGFDDSGRNYDKNGNVNNWWLQSDEENFKARTQVLVDWFNGIEVLPGLFANGTFTLGENIADNGGVNISYLALQKAKEQGKIAEKLDDFNYDERFFIAYAQVWASNIRDEEIIRRTKEGVHSIERWRVNGTLPHINAFADTYQLKEGDRMFLAPEKRAEIW